MRNLLTGLFCLLSTFAFSLDPNHFSITRVTAPYFIVDGNTPTTLTKAYVGFEIKNNSNSGVTYTGLKFTITSIGTTVVGQNYSIVSPASGIINVGTLAPGESRVCYYYIGYPSSTTPQANFNVQLSDNTASWKTTTFNIRNRSSISANAGGTATQTFINQDIIGGLVYDDVTYTVGNVQTNDESDFQVAVSSSFDPTKVLLLATQVTASAVPGIPVGTTDSLYFLTGNGSNGATITVRWTFKISATNFTTYLLPCAGSTSGSTNYKYALNTNLGSGSPITISSSANPLTVTKTANKSIYTPNELATFTVTINNPGAYPVTIDKITDQLPSGFSFNSIDATSAVTTGNSTIVPSSGNTGSISFEGGVLSGSNNSYYIPAGGSLILKYKAYAPSSPASNLSSIARGYVGDTEIGNASVTVSVSNTLPLTLLSLNGEWLGDRAQLSWTTSGEYNTDHIDIERSSSSADFMKIGERAAAGFSSSLINYSFTDLAPAQDNNRYRLKLLDIDGRTTYSPVIILGKKQYSLSLAAVYPLPFTDHVNINLNADRSMPVRLDLLNSAGATVATRQCQAVRGQNYILIPELEKLASGIYLLKIDAGGEHIGKVIIK